jgi:hypothetical protein
VPRTERSGVTVTMSVSVGRRRMQLLLRSSRVWAARSRRRSSMEGRRDGTTAEKVRRIAGQHEARGLSDNLQRQVQFQVNTARRARKFRFRNAISHPLERGVQHCQTRSKVSVSKCHLTPPRARFTSLEGSHRSRVRSASLEGSRLPRAGSASLEGPRLPRSRSASFEGSHLPRVRSASLEGPSRAHPLLHACTGI